MIDILESSTGPGSAYHALGILWVGLANRAPNPTVQRQIPAVYSSLDHFPPQRLGSENMPVPRDRGIGEKNIVSCFCILITGHYYLVKLDSKLVVSGKVNACFGVSYRNKRIKLLAHEGTRVLYATTASILDPKVQCTVVSSTSGM